MGTARFLLLCAAGLLLAHPAAAQITEPNGLVVPRMSGEVQLYTLFSMRGESIDWIADAHATPAVFSPLCSFQATFVMNQAGSHYGVSWYNATGGMPPASDLHMIMPPGSPVGTVISSMSIRSDPAYLGGLIGFALMGGQIHYSETNWNPVCTGCSPPAAWQMALIYASTVTPNAYYVAFEDGTVGSGPGNFSNDGDFNDDVFYFEGITCSGGGMPCMTTMPGVCANGVEQCAGGGTLSCVSVVSPGTETCNGLDDNCDGATDEGDLCPTDFVCDRGSCVHRCNSAEFGCTPPLVCDTGFCVDGACAGITCAAGSVCHGGTCRAPCDGVTCPTPTVCRVDRCVDPCSGVTCGMGQVCDGGVCRDDCSCSPCAGALACDTASGVCTDPLCMSVVCDPGTHCTGGTCLDDCAGAVCPPGEICTTGACVPAPPPPDGGTPDIDGGGSGFDGGGSGGDGGPFDSGRHGPHTTTSGGCCSTAIGARSDGALYAFVFLAVLVRRRNTQRSPL